MQISSAVLGALCGMAVMAVPQSKGTFDISTFDQSPHLSAQWSVSRNSAIRMIYLAMRKFQHFHVLHHHVTIIPPPPPSPSLLLLPRNKGWVLILQLPYF